MGRYSCRSGVDGAGVGGGEGEKTDWYADEPGNPLLSGVESRDADGEDSGESGGNADSA